MDELKLVFTSGLHLFCFQIVILAKDSFDRWR